MNTPRSITKGLLATVISLALLCATAGAALAAPALPTHAKVWKADPAIGSTISSAPTKVTVFALESIDPKRSSLQVYGPGPDATDTLISQGKTQFPLADSKQMWIAIAPTSGHVNGVYIVFWQTVSADDGDAASGSFTFTVNTSAASSATPTPTPSQSSVSTPASTSGSSGTPVWVPLVAALVALLVGLGAGLGLGRRRPASASLSSMRASIAQAREEEEAGKRP
jgi:methionine-rich copper-binding protein CopC